MLNFNLKLLCIQLRSFWMEFIKLIANHGNSYNFNVKWQVWEFWTLFFTPLAVTVSPQGVGRTNINESYIYDTFFVGSVASILLLVKGYELFCWQIYEERFGVYFICYCSFFDFEKSNFDCERSVYIVCRICHRFLLFYSLVFIKISVWIIQAFDKAGFPCY